MSSPSNLLQAGVDAIKRKQYFEAIQALEAFCALQTDAPTKEYFQAQMWLIRAYQENGQSALAIELCQQMIASPHPQVKAWAERVLPTLTASQSAPGAPTAPAPAVSSTAEPLSTSEESVAPQPGSQEWLSPEAAAELYKTGSHALKLKKFAEAVPLLEAYCQQADPSTGDYAQVQMWLVKAYKGNGQDAAAIALGQTLMESDREYVKTWAKQFLATNAPAVISPATATAEPAGSDGAPASASRQSAPPAGSAPGSSTPPPKAGRAALGGVKLTMRGVAANLSLASGVTISLLFGMVLVLVLSLLLIVENNNPTQGLAIAIGITIVVNLLVFFISPLIMDLIQGWLYGTRWIDIREIERRNPETAKVLREVCQKHKLTLPRLGMIEDDNPTAFTYGSLPNTARLVVSRGLLKYLDDDEVATVYAHELGHIVHWDFAVMTLAATLVQMAYLLYVYVDELAAHVDDKRVKNAARSTALMAYIFYIVGEYLLLYLSRTREYYADHFAAEVTGNPNGLSRALVKIAYGILEVGSRNQEPSRILQGTRALGIADPKSAAFTGTAYRVASEPHKVGRVFLWDMFNPWAWWMELNSTHPLTGKRVRALSTYAEQLGLDTEFDMARVIREGRTLNRQKLYGNFVTDIILFWADWLGLAIGLLGGLLVFVIKPSNIRMLVNAIQDDPEIFVTLVQVSFVTILPACLLGFGFGTLVKMVFMYPDFNRAPETDVLALMSDPYASPLRGRAVTLSGEIIGRGDAGYRFGSDLKLQDHTGLIYLRYASRFGPLGNFLFGMSQAESFVHQEVKAVGWFRRGIMPWVDFVRLDCESKWTVRSYHRFWLLVLGLGCIALGFALPSLMR